MDGCGHCQNLAPHYSKAATSLKNVAKFAAVPLAAGELVAALQKRFNFQVPGVPVLKVLSPERRGTRTSMYSNDYGGERTAEGRTCPFISCARVEKT